MCQVPLNHLNLGAIVAKTWGMLQLKVSGPTGTDLMLVTSKEAIVAKLKEIGCSLGQRYICWFIDVLFTEYLTYLTEIDRATLECLAQLFSGTSNSEFFWDVPGSDVVISS